MLISLIVASNIVFTVFYTLNFYTFIRCILANIADRYWLN